MTRQGRTPLAPAVWTQHAIASFTRLEHRPARIDPAPASIPLGCISDARRAKALNVLERCREEICEHLDFGAVGWEAAGRRHVLLWDLMVVSVASDGSDLRADWPAHERDMSVCIPRADLSIPIGSYRWYTAFDPVLFEAARSTGLDVRTLDGGPTGEWMRQSLRRTFRRYVDWNRLRRAVLGQLAPDPLDVSLTRRIFGGCAPGFREFNWVHRHSPELALVAIENPRLVPFLRIAAANPVDGPLEAFEGLLRDARINASARRKLEVWGYPVFGEALDAALFSDAASLMSKLANALDRLQVRNEPPSVFGALAVRDAKAIYPDWFLRALLDELWLLEDEGFDQTPPLLYSEAIRWLDTDPPPPDSNQRRAGWRWVEARASAHSAAEEEGATRTWSVPCGDFETGPWRVVAIRNRRELQEEARAMHNCLERYEADCRFEAMAVYSIRDRASGGRAACFSLELDLEDHVWRLGQVSGRGNCRVAQELVGVALASLARCRLQARAAPS